MNKLANATGGRLVQTSVDNRDIETLNRYVERNMQLNGDSSMPWQDMGYPLLLPIAIIMMLWFRKGWLVQWCLVVTVSTSLFATPNAMAETVSLSVERTAQPKMMTVWEKTEQWWWDLWLTPDQQGQRWWNQGQYLQAAKHFNDPLRKGTAYYYAGEYALAHSAFLTMQNDPSDEAKDLGLYNAATALARQREYLAARNLLRSLADKETLSSKLRADVEHNLRVIGGIVEEINRTSASQAGSTDGPEESIELGDNPQTAEGVDEQTVAEMMLKETLNANEILGSDALADKWLKRVEADPKYFLAAKFQIQLHQGAKTSDTTLGQQEHKQ